MGRLCLMVLFEFFAAIPLLSAAAPGISLQATNVSIPGQGTAQGQFTVTSINGFSGSVSVSCTGPNSEILPNLVLPECNGPAPNITVPANGSASGTISFYPPWADPYSARAHPLPVLAVVAVGSIVLLPRLKSNRCRWFACLVLGCSMIPLCLLVGCLGNGGLAMTPGTFQYTLNASGNGVSASSAFKVTVQCNSCP